MEPSSELHHNLSTHPDISPPKYPPKNILNRIFSKEPKPSSNILETIDSLSQATQEGKYTLLSSPHVDELRYVFDHLQNALTESTSPTNILRITPQPNCSSEQFFGQLVSAWNQSHPEHHFAPPDSQLGTSYQIASTIRYFLSQTDQNVFILVDSVQNITPSARNNLIPLFRAFDNDVTDPNHDRLTIAISTTDPDNLIPNRNITPYNSATAFKLKF